MSTRWLGTNDALVALINAFATRVSTLNAQRGRFLILAIEAFPAKPATPWPAWIGPPSEPRIPCAIVDGAAKVRDLNCKSMAEGRGATVTARFGPDGITLCDPNRASEGADKVFQRIYGKAI